MISTWQALVAHLLVAVFIVAALVVLAIHGTIPGSDAFTGIMAIAVGAGVVAGANIGTPGPGPPGPPGPAGLTGPQGPPST